MENFWQIVGYVMGPGGLIMLWLARKERKAAENLSAGNALDIMQRVYARFVKDTSIEIGQMREEIKMLTEIVEAYKTTCNNCPNNSKK